MGLNYLFVASGVVFTIGYSFCKLSTCKLNDGINASLVRADRHVADIHKVHVIHRKIPITMRYRDEALHSWNGPQYTDTDKILDASEDYYSMVQSPSWEANRVCS